MSRRIGVVAGLALGLVAALPAWAAQEALVLRQRAEQLAAQDRCEEALPRAQRARELEPGDARAALLAGRCQLRLGLYQDAIASLHTARELDPKLSGVSTDLAQCHYHLDQFSEANAELAKAEQENPDDARMHLYRGLLLLREAKQVEAAEAFDRASSLDPSLAGAAALYSGRSWEGAHERDKAAAALERARLAEPGSEWAKEAERELERLDEPYKRHVWGRARVGVEYDDNVPRRFDGSIDPLTGSNFGLPDTGKDHDVRIVFDGDVGGELLRDPDRSLGVVGGYRGNVHTQRFNQFDLQNPWISAWYDERLGEDTWLRLQPFGGYAWLEKDPFVIHGGGQATVSHAFSEQLVGRVFTRANVNDYLFRILPDPVLTVLSPALGADARRRRNRDGTQYTLGTEGSYEFASTLTRLTLGTAYEPYAAEGKDWDRNGYRGWAVLRQPLPLPIDVRFDVYGSFAYHDYDHRSSFLPANLYVFGQGPDRLDRIWEVQTDLTWDVTQWLALSARWNYIDNYSNTDVFDFDRHLVGGYLTVFLDN